MEIQIVDMLDEQPLEQLSSNRLYIIFDKHLNSSNFNLQQAENNLHQFFDELQEISINNLFICLKNDFQKAKYWNAYQRGLQKTVFLIFLINENISDYISTQKQLLIGLQVFLYQILRQDQEQMRFNTQILQYKALISYFNLVLLQQQKAFKQKLALQIGLKNPQLLKFQIFEDQKLSQNSFLQRFFFFVFENNSQIYYIEKIIYYLRKFQWKLKSLFVQFLFQKLNIDICSLSDFQSISWHLIQSNVPIRSDKISYLYLNFLLKNPIKFAQCLIQSFSSLSTSFQDSQSIYNYLFIIYIQNCLLNDNKAKLFNRLPISASIVQYLKINIKQVIRSFFTSRNQNINAILLTCNHNDFQRFSSLKLYCELMKYFIRCIYENIQVQVVFSIVVSGILSFFDNIYDNSGSFDKQNLDKKEHFLNFKFQDADINQFQKMTNEWKKMVDFYQKRKFSKNLLLSIYLLQIFCQKINQVRYYTSRRIFYFNENLQNIQHKSMDFIISSIQFWFQEVYALNKNESKNQILNNSNEVKYIQQEIIYDLTQKIIILSSLIIIQQWLASHLFSNLIEDEDDFIWDLWDNIQQYFKNKITKDQKKQLQHFNFINFKQIQCLKRDKQNYSQEQQENQPKSLFAKNKQRKIQLKKSKNVETSIKAQKEKCLREQIVKSQIFNISEFQFYKNLQKQMNKLEQSDYGLSRSFQKSMNLANIVKIQKKYRTICHVKKH